MWCISSMNWSIGMMLARRGDDVASSSEKMGTLCVAPPSTPSIMYIMPNILWIAFVLSITVIDIKFVSVCIGCVCMGTMLGKPRFYGNKKCMVHRLGPYLIRIPDPQSLSYSIVLEYIYIYDNMVFFRRFTKKNLETFS